MKFILTNPLFTLPPYRLPLMLAAAAAMLLHVNPTPLNHFAALPGRMSISHEKDLIIVDNANSGTNVSTTMCASRYARHCAKITDLTLVIGQVEGDGAVCEGFSPDQIAVRHREDPAPPCHLGGQASRTGNRCLPFCQEIRSMLSAQLLRKAEMLPCRRLRKDPLSLP